MVTVTQEKKSLKETADEEAAAVEEEFEGLDTEAPEEEAEEEQYVRPKPTKKQVKTAEKVWDTIQEADIIGADNAVSSLIQLIDVHPLFTPPEEWPAAEEAEYCQSELIERMATVLCKGAKKLWVNPDDLVFLWRNKDKWQSGGQTVRGNVARFPTRVRHLLDGKLAAIEINYHHFLTLNPLQRTFTLYHELRQISAEGKLNQPDFGGFYDEIEVFGPRVFREMVELARVVEVGSRVDHQYQLPLFDDEE